MEIKIISFSCKHEEGECGLSAESVPGAVTTAALRISPTEVTPWKTTLAGSDREACQDAVQLSAASIENSPIALLTLGPTAFYEKYKTRMSEFTIYWTNCHN